LAKKVNAQITFEIEQIDRLFASYTNLLESAQKRRPNLVKITVLASILHSFYNGLENIFLSIAKELDKQVPASSQWHRDLLVQMTQETENRVPVISTELAQKLANYLGFRHFYRHSYSLLLRLERVEKACVTRTRCLDSGEGRALRIPQQFGLDLHVYIKSRDRAGFRSLP
jgi:hypothetical protein